MEITKLVHKYRPNGNWFQRSQSEIQRIVVHHSAYPHDNSSDDVRLRTMMGWHLKNGWAGLSYHFVITKNGNIYQLNNFEDITWTDFQNRNSLSILIDGYFHPPKNDEPTNEQLESLKKLLDWLCNENPQFPAGQKDVIGHRDIATIFNRSDWATACPGDNLYPCIQEFKNTGNITINKTEETSMSQEDKNKLIGQGVDEARHTINSLLNSPEFNGLQDSNNNGHWRGILFAKDTPFIDSVKNCIRQILNFAKDNKKGVEEASKVIVELRTALDVSEKQIKNLENERYEIAKSNSDLVDSYADLEKRAKELETENIRLRNTNSQPVYNSSTKPFWDSKKIFANISAIIIALPTFTEFIPNDLKLFWLAGVFVTNITYQIIQGNIDKEYLTSVYTLFKNR